MFRPRCARLPVNSDRSSLSPFSLNTLSSFPRFVLHQQGLSRTPWAFLSALQFLPVLHLHSFMTSRSRHLGLSSLCFNFACLRDAQPVSLALQVGIAEVHTREHLPQTKIEAHAAKMRDGSLLTPSKTASGMPAAMDTMRASSLRCGATSRSTAGTTSGFTARTTTSDSEATWAQNKRTQAGR